MPPSHHALAVAQNSGNAARHENDQRQDFLVQLLGQGDSLEVARNKPFIQSDLEGQTIRCWDEASTAASDERDEFKPAMAAECIDGPLQSGEHFCDIHRSTLSLEESDVGMPPHQRRQPIR